MNNEEIIRKKYEISFLIRSESDDLTVKKIIEKNGGQDVKVVPAVKTRLAYPIKKENYAFFGVAYFSSSPETIEAISGDLRLQNAVLRFLIVTPPIVKGEGERTERRPSLKSKTAVPSPATAPAMPAAGSLSNEELEKTLEEILK
ncbi:MAG: 30S ribosomal protein S6 [Parcubacteria group bacterium]|nr:30S ribosomal protein S6 [Parcubacteria group bacterium]